MPAANAQVGLANPLETTTEFSSHDGYAFLGLEAKLPFVYSSKEWPASPLTASPSSDPVCELDVRSCFGDKFSSLDEGEVDVSSVFKRVAFEQTQCGDCLIALLVGKSGVRGLEAFLPEEDADADTHEMPVITLPGSMRIRWQDVDYAAIPGGPGTSRQKVRPPSSTAELPLINSCTVSRRPPRSSSDTLTPSDSPPRPSNLSATPEPASRRA